MVKQLSPWFYGAGCTRFKAFTPSPVLVSGITERWKHRALGVTVCEAAVSFQ